MKLECYGRVIGCQTTSRRQKQDYSLKKKNSSVMRAFTESIESLWRTSYRKDTPER